MDEGFRTVFNVDLLPRDVWEAARFPGVRDGEWRVPGFPCFGADAPGSRVTVIEAERERRLRLRKEDEPCAGTEIGIEMEPANAAGWPTRVTLAQTGFGPAPAAMRAVLETHWIQIVADFRLYVEHGVHAPATRWGADLGALTRQTPVGLELVEVAGDGFSARCGFESGDLLLSVGGIRIHDLTQLWTVLAMVDPDAETTATVVRNRTPLTATAGFSF